MTMIMHNFEYYLHREKRDIFLLRIINQNRSVLFYDQDFEANKLVEKQQLEWLDQQGVEYFHSCPPEILMGWLGHYYVGFDGPEDPRIKLYSIQFEDANGKSLEPDKYQMLCMSYNDWVSSGKLAEYEQYLIDREDPNWEY
jgi:hypothetical protein